MSMQAVGLITVATPGTAVAISASSKSCSKINFQPMKSLAPAVQNTGAIYICVKGGSRATASSIRYILASGQVAVTMQQVSASEDLSNYVVDADNAGDGCFVTYI